MFQRILVPLDGSERAERALPVAARLARASHGTVIVVNVLDVNLIPSAAPEMVISESVIQSESTQANDYLTHATASMQQEGITIEKCVQFGLPASMILFAIASYNADLVIMCSHGRTGFIRWALGSIADKITRISHIPVLVLREHGPIPTGIHANPTRPPQVLVPLDGSTAAKAAIGPAAALAAGLASTAPGEVHLTRIVPPIANHLSTLEPRSLEDSVQKATHTLQQTIQNVRDGFEAPSIASLGIKLTSSVVANTDVAHAIIQIAENGADVEDSDGCDVIAMTTHGRMGLEHLALGSTTERVLHATQRPILVVPILHRTVPKNTANKHYQEEPMNALPH